MVLSAANCKKKCPAKIFLYKPENNLKNPEKILSRLSSKTFIQVSNKWLNRKWYDEIQVLKQGERYTNKWIQLSYKAMRQIGLLIIYV